MFVCRFVVFRIFLLLCNKSLQHLYLAKLKTVPTKHCFLPPLPPAPCLGSGQLSTTVYTPEYLCEFRLKVPLWVLGLDGLPAPLPPAAPAALMVSPKAFPYKSLALDAQIQVCIWVLSIKILNLKFGLIFYSL